MKKLSRYSFGMGDRFAHQAAWQLKTIIEAQKNGVEITPVWNKSNREHTTIGSEPADTLRAAEESIKEAGYSKQWFIDADHVNLDTVDRFLRTSNFFTIDVASYIGEKSEAKEEEDFMGEMRQFIGNLEVPGLKTAFNITEEMLRDIADQYLYATQMAGETYKRIEAEKGKGNFITEVSMDEVPNPQTPVELFFILAMLAHYNVPAQTIAPKFTGRFNKGVDYVGDLNAFNTEYEANLMVIDFAILQFGLPEELKLSIHSGSDKFSIYPIIKELSKKHNKGFHLKTAGTTWLEEVIGLALAGGEALVFVKNLYSRALTDVKKLCAPYADVIDIDENKLPSAMEVQGWTGEEFANALRHIPEHLQYNSNLRQLVHVGYKLAAERIDQYNMLLKKHADIVGQCVFENLYERHAKRLFVD
ncbi:tagaturonate epimerase family protein [Marinilabilia salmonicolor]|uniref:tagaturonate epimerase family protein n=1 Tax=Marinilabilia salmonicolor TaxID=989 RepID=UPI00029AE554|nr:tagaturonate epimerase family protein [Marinilabilia salmonicolor]